ncbi:hypothetical protein GCM10022252_79400 [Streptosporangium oxazolinicum]|uniref:Tyr recombinase domain-containing protein n=1 Tax=Streptosporangium oxazolinicum TaxID=909287 RepID=A0ABP8BNM0_9ACTN
MITTGPFRGVASRSGCIPGLTVAGRSRSQACASSATPSPAPAGGDLPGGRGGPLSYDAAHHRWQIHCTATRVEIDIHRLRHAHATELINAGVSIEGVRRLGHASTETTQLYALLDDKVTDAEIRAARRRRDQATS